MKGLVSVVIPTFNYGRYLDECLKSVLRQSHGQLEIIVVDDGSTDNTAEIVKPYKRHIRYIYQDNSGLSSARNAGLSKSSGDYIQLLDADDFLHEKAIEHRLYSLVRENSDWSVCQNRYFQERPAHFLPNFIGPRWGLRSKNLGPQLFRSNIAPPHAFLASRKLYEAVGDFDVNLGACEDYDYWLRALKCGFSPLYSSQGMVYYRKHEQSMSANFQRQWEFDALMHHRVAEILAGNSYREPSESNLLCSLYALAGLLRTIRRLQSLNTEATTALFLLMETWIPEVRARMPAIMSISDPMEFRFVVLEISRQAVAVQFTSGGTERTKLMGLLENILAEASFSKSFRDFLHCCLVGRSVNLKVVLDNARCLFSAGEQKTLLNKFSNL